MDFELEKQRYLRRLLTDNGAEELEAWTRILLAADEALMIGEVELAEQLYKFALAFAEEYMNSDAIVTALMCLSRCYDKQQRLMEAETAYARATRILEDNLLKG